MRAAISPGRLSGGGAVYQDRGALNFSFILPKTAFDIARQLSILGMAAGAFGIQAQALGRGDLFAVGRRFSVNAYFKAGSAALHHGTLYVDTGLDQMAQFLSAGGGDLAAPNPPDTAAHTINLRALNPAVSVEELEQGPLLGLCPRLWRAASLVGRAHSGRPVHRRAHGALLRSQMGLSRGHGLHLQRVGALFPGDR